MHKLIVVFTVFFSFMVSAYAGDLINPRPVPNSNYELAEDAADNLWCKNCAGQSGWHEVAGLSGDFHTGGDVIGAGWDYALYWQDMGSSCMYGNWNILNLRTGEIKSFGPSPENIPELCQLEPDAVSYEITENGWTMTILGKTYKGK
ncbi:hypothetical protein FGS56_14440 [Salmonella enterica]|nr:hypothetical protein [Salmonella enterica]